MISKFVASLSLAPTPSLSFLDGPFIRKKDC